MGLRTVMGFTGTHCKDGRCFEACHKVGNSPLLWGFNKMDAQCTPKLEIRDVLVQEDSLALYIS